MGILDDAIREHLDLKRKHGSRDAELRELEDEAFGSGDQPDPFVGGELYGEVAATGTVEAGNEEPTRLVEGESLQPAEPAPESEGLRPTEGPPAPEDVRSSESDPEALQPSEPGAAPELETSDQSITAEPPGPIPGQVELPGQDEIPGQERLDAEPEPRPSTEEPESYRPVEDTSEQTPEPPSPSESLEELIAEEEPFPEDSEGPPPPPVTSEAEREPEARPLEPQPDAQAPPDPESSAPDPPPPPPDPSSEPPGRARGRADVPTQEHPPPGDTGDLPPLPDDEPELGRPDTSYELPSMEERPPADEPVSEEEPISDEDALPEDAASASSDGPQLYDFETDEGSMPPSSSESAVDDDFEALGPAEETPYLDEEEAYPEGPASEVESGGEGYEEPGTEVRPAVEDEEPEERRSFDTEERLETEEGEEDLWFEKGPPKDFDFDD
jgi:hypothetical protein